MFDPDPWRRLRRIAWYSLVAYFVLAWVGVVTLLFDRGLGDEWLRLVPAAADGPEVYGSVSGEVRNVLGDLVPGAMVRVGDEWVQADNSSRYVVEGVPVGMHTLELTAPGYQRQQLTIQVEPGENHPPIMSDTGLWPEVLAISFHVFVNSDKSGEPHLFGYFGMANGSSDSIRVYSVLLEDPQGRPVYDLVQDEEPRQTFLAMLEEIAVRKEEDYYWLVPEHIVFEGELPSTVEPVEGSYQVTVIYSVGRDDRPIELTAADLANPEPDWNPRLP